MAKFSCSLAFLLAICLATPALAADLYVDNSLAGNCADYSPGGGCGSGSDQAYNTLTEAGNLAVAGDNVLIRAGTYNETLFPQNSGTAGNPITFRAYDEEYVQITATPYLDSTQWGDKDGWHFGFYMWDKHYITIEGIHFHDITHSWGRAVHSSNIVVKGNNFTQLGTGGILKSINFIDCNRISILNNTLDDASDNIALIGTSYSLIEGNTVTKGGHTLWAIKCGNYNIVRNNHFDNHDQKIGEIYDCHDDRSHTDQTYFGLLGYNHAKHNLVEGNTFAYTAPNDDGGGPYNSIQYAGQEGIIRNNVFFESHGTALGMANYQEEAMYNLHNRIYNNVFYDNMRGGVVTGGSSDPTRFTDNLFKNNIFYQNYPGPIGWADNHLSATQISHHDMDNFRFEYNNIINNGPGEADVIWDSYNHRISLADAESTYPLLYGSNIEIDPGFEDETVHDFTLQTGSQMINAGTFLTIVTSPSGSGSQITVEDAGYFFDGFGIVGEVGDLIQLEDQTQTARILSINYGTNILTLDTSLDWTAGQGVSLPFSGTKPDMGAFEFQGSICIDTDTLLGHIDQWKGGSLSMPALINMIASWKAGTGCP